MAYTVAVHVKADLFTPWALGPKITLTAGDTPTFTVIFDGAASISSPVFTVYQGSKDVTSTVMPSGSASASGNIATAKPLTALTGRKYYVMNVATAEYPIKSIKFLVKKASAKQ